MLRNPLFLADPAPHKPRAKRETDVLRDKAWLKAIRDMPCIFTGLRATNCESVVPAHIGTAGKSIKSPDDEILPVLHSVHHRMHNGGGEIEVFRNAPADVLRAAFRALARELYRGWKDSR